MPTKSQHDVEVVQDVEHLQPAQFHHLRRDAADNRGTTTMELAPPTPRHHDVLVLPGMPPGSFLRPGPAKPSIP